jgi:phage tail protein X
MRGGFVTACYREYGKRIRFTAALPANNGLHPTANQPVFRGQAAATMPVVGVGLVGSAAGEAERWASIITLDVIHELRYYNKA